MADVLVVVGGRRYSFASELAAEAWLRGRRKGAVSARHRTRQTGEASEWARKAEETRSWESSPHARSSASDTKTALYPSQASGKTNDSGASCVLRLAPAAGGDDAGA